MSAGFPDLRFVIVVGKGGVGKTTVASALALELAQRGRRVLFAMCNVKERLSHMLEVPPIGPQIVSVLPNIDAVNMEPGAALEEYGMMVLKLRTLYKLVFGNRLVASFLRGTPGMESWAMLGKAQFHAFEQLPDGRPRYDSVIVDAPATGHGLELLRVPKVIREVVPPGLLRRDADRAWDLFSDRRRAGMLIASVPEELPANESIELYRSLRDELGLPIAGLALNMVLPRVFDDAQRSALERLHATLDEGALADYVEAGRARAERERMQREHIERLAREIPVPRFELPTLFTKDLRRPELDLLARAFERR